jgi:hypothetical protein
MMYCFGKLWFKSKHWRSLNKFNKYSFVQQLPPPDFVHEASFAVEATTIHLMTHQAITFCDEAWFLLSSLLFIMQLGHHKLADQIS